MVRERRQESVALVCSMATRCGGALAGVGRAAPPDPLVRVRFPRWHRALTVEVGAVVLLQRVRADPAGGAPYPSHHWDYRFRVVDFDDEQRCVVCDGSTRAAMDHVRARLADEFGSRVAVGDITRSVAQAHADLGHLSPAALPELVERLARIRLLDRSRA